MTKEAGPFRLRALLGAASLALLTASLLIHWKRQAVATRQLENETQIEAARSRIQSLLRQTTSPTVTRPPALPARVEEPKSPEARGAPDRGTLAPRYRSNPEATRTLATTWARLRLGRFYRTAGLSDSQKSTLESILAEYGPMLELRFDPNSVSVDASNPRKIREESDLAEEIARKARPALGEGAARQLAEALLTQDLMAVTDSVRVGSFNTGEPLTSQQEETLLSALREAQFPLNQPLRRVRRENMNWDRLSATAATILSPSQMEAFRAAEASARFASEYARATGNAPPLTLPAP